MNNLVIGNTSQISYYFPEEYEKISSRNIDYKFYEDKFYDRIFLVYAEQRTYLGKSDLFYDINVTYTLEVINFFKDKCNKIIIYGTSELWNNCNGLIDINTPFNYNHSDYIKSKEILIEKTQDIENLIVIHPCNFNTIHRKGDFLFGKIFNSIINEKPIEIGNTYFYRDMIRPELVVERSILSDKDEIVGSGRLTFVNQFIRDLYGMFNLNYEKFVTEKMDDLNRNIFYLKSKECLYLYDNMLNKTFYELRNIKLKKYHEEKYGENTANS